MHAFGSKLRSSAMASAQPVGVSALSTPAGQPPKRERTHGDDPDSAAEPTRKAPRVAQDGVPVAPVSDAERLDALLKQMAANARELEALPLQLLDAKQRAAAKSASTSLYVLVRDSDQRKEELAQKRLNNEEQWPVLRPGRGHARPPPGHRSGRGCAGVPAVCAGGQ